MKPKTKAQLSAELDEMKAKLRESWGVAGRLRSDLFAEQTINMRLRAENAWLRRQLGIDKSK